MLVSICMSLSVCVYMYVYAHVAKVIGNVGVDKLAPWKDNVNSILTEMFPNLN